MDITTIIFSTFFGAIGLGYIVYGRKEQKGLPLLAGVGLSVFPFFISNLLLVILIGAGLILLPWFIES